MNWRGAVLGNRYMATLTGNYALNLKQPSEIDLNFDPTVRAGSLDNTADLWIGQTHLNACGATSYWRGDIDEIEMFNRALAIFPGYAEAQEGLQRVQRS